MNAELTRKFKALMESEMFHISFLYLLSYGFLLINFDGVYFDDWTAFDQPKEKIINEYIQAGRPLRGFIFYYMLSYGGVWIFRLTTFLYFLLAAFALNSVLKSISAIDKADRILLVLFFQLLPFNSSRVSLVVNIYSCCYMLFFIGLWLFSEYLKNPTFLKRFLSLLAFFISFFVSSILVFYILVLFYFIYISWERTKNFKDLLGQFLKHFDFWFLPFLFWVTKHYIYPPFGYYGTLNKITLEGLVNAVPFSFGLVFVAISELLVRLFTQPINLWIAIIFLLARYLVKFYDNEIPQNSSRRTLSYFMLLGLVLAYFAIYPYATIGKLPSFTDWSSRNQILLPLGVSFFLVYGLKGGGLIKFNKNWVRTASCIFLALFVIQNNQIYLDYYKDWAKQVAMVEHFKKSPVIKNNRSFLVQDNSMDLNADNRTYRYYEYSGLLRQAFGDETRFAQDRNRFEGFAKTRHYRSAEFPNNLSEFVEEDPSHLIVIEKYQSLDFKMLVRLILYSFLDQSKFKKYAKDLIQVRTQPLESPLFNP